MAPGLLTAEKYGDFIIQTLIVEGPRSRQGVHDLTQFSPLLFREMTIMIFVQIRKLTFRRVTPDHTADKWPGHPTKTCLSSRLSHICKRQLPLSVYSDQNPESYP